MEARGVLGPGNNGEAQPSQTVAVAVGRHRRVRPGMCQGALRSLERSCLLEDPFFMSEESESQRPVGREE